MRLRFMMTREDAINAQLALIDHEPALRQSVTRGRWIATAVVLAIGTPLMLMYPWSSLIFALAALVQYCVYPRRFRERIVKARRKALDRYGQGIMGEHELEIADDGLHERTQYDQHVHRWSAVREGVTSADGSLLLIVLTNGSAHAVTAAGVLEGDLAAFTAALARQVPMHSLDRGWRADEVVRRQRSWGRVVHPIAQGLLISVLLYDPAWWVVDQLFPDNLSYRLYYMVHAVLLTLPPLILVAYMVRRPRIEDTECRCRRCSHMLRGLSEPRCPECGEAI